MRNAKKEKNADRQPYAKKSFGQNFLVDDNYIGKIIAALNPQAGEKIVEIGAGRGALTEKLVAAGANVVAVELERAMLAVLKEKFAGAENFSLIEADALKVDFSSLLAPSSTAKLKLVANLPYYISTAILQKLIAHRDVFAEMILMFQREVVERITAPVGSSERGFLTVLVEESLAAEKLFDVSPGAFRPSPKVWSAVVKLTPKSDQTASGDEKFKALVSHAFQQKRKTLRNNLKQFAPFADFDKNNWENIFAAAKISPERRAETLTIEEWRKLASAIYPEK